MKNAFGEIIAIRSSTGEWMHRNCIKAIPSGNSVCDICKELKYIISQSSSKTTTYKYADLDDKKSSLVDSYIKLLSNHATSRCVSLINLHVEYATTVGNNMLNRFHWKVKDDDVEGGERYRDEFFLLIPLLEMVGKKVRNVLRGKPSMGLDFTHFPTPSDSTRKRFFKERAMTNILNVRVP